MSSTPLIEAIDLRKHYAAGRSWLGAGGPVVKALDGVSFTIRSGKTLGLVGESGCGKTTLGRTLIQLQTPTSGEVLLNGRDITGLNRQQMAEIRRHMQIIFQDPYASLSPRRTVGQTLLEPLEQHKIGSPVQRKARVQELLEVVGLRPSVLHRFPHEFSGGQRQRIGIARALALHPEFIVADEAVSALDVSVQSQVLNLLRDLQQDLGIAMLFISHDLAVVQHISDHVGVMYLGKLVEIGDAAEIYNHPRHPYTRALLSAAPIAQPGRPGRRILLEGEVPSPSNPPSGCAFHTRCPQATDRCRKETPKRKNLGSKENPLLVNCHLYDE